MEITIGLWPQPIDKSLNKDLVRNCLTCEIVFRAERSRRKYCSKNCSDKGYITRVKRICPICTKEFEIPNCRNKVKKLVYCSVTCYGISRRKRKPKSRSDIKRFLKIRGKFVKCNRCNYNIHLEILQPHHKDGDSTNNDENNIEILCPNCHMIEHHVLSSKPQRNTRYKKKLLSTESS